MTHMLICSLCWYVIFHTLHYTLQHAATHCNTLQHTATHCNTLQHTATHCWYVIFHTLHYCSTECTRINGVMNYTVELWRTCWYVLFVDTLSFTHSTTARQMYWITPCISVCHHSYVIFHTLHYCSTECTRINGVMNYTVHKVGVISQMLNDDTHLCMGLFSTFGTKCEAFHAC